MKEDQKAWEEYLQKYYQEFVRACEHPVSIACVTEKIRLAFLTGFLRGQIKELRKKLDNP